MDLVELKLMVGDNNYFDRLLEGQRTIHHGKIVSFESQHNKIRKHIRNHYPRGKVANKLISEYYSKRITRFL